VGDPPKINPFKSKESGLRISINITPYKKYERSVKIMSANDYSLRNIGAHD